MIFLLLKLLVGLVFIGALIAAAYALKTTIDEAFGTPKS